MTVGDTPVGMFGKTGYFMENDEVAHRIRSLVPANSDMHTIQIDLIWN